MSVNLSVYTVGEANPDSLCTMHSTKRVRISLSQCVVPYSFNLCHTTQVDTFAFLKQNKSYFHIRYAIPTP